MATLYGIKNCDTVKKARRWLDDNAHSADFHDLRADGIDEATITQWLTLVGHKVLVNKRSTTWKQLSDTEKDAALGEQAAALLAQHPTLIKRPVLVLDGQVYVGFAANQYQELFSN